MAWCLHDILPVLQSVMMLPGQQLGVASQLDFSVCGAPHAPASRGLHSQAEYEATWPTKRKTNKVLRESMVVVVVVVRKINSFLFYGLFGGNCARWRK
mmetsp:Transcript_1433/g.3299  ORF Transcript_1433/g.3299 Transcript_1433/m.3299 type:complete len:98 (-) Transcript_1433:51-344(-)